MEQTRTFKPGDKVKIRADVAGKWGGVVFVVIRYLQKNVELGIEGHTRKMRCQPHLLIPADADVASTPVAYEPPLFAGTLIRFKDELFVVLAQMGTGRYRIVKLGGDKGRYYTNVVRSQFEILDPTEMMI